MIVPDELRIPPWRTPGLWREINDAMAAAVQRRRHRLETAIMRSRLVEEGIAGLAGVMDTLCGLSCPFCRDSCCQRATIWYDFQDLLYLHLAGLPLPRVQIAREPGQPCPYQGPAGCIQPRVVRPFICTWYLCPVQMKALGQMDEPLAEGMMPALARLKLARIDMESLFVQAVAACDQSGL